MKSNRFNPSITLADQVLEEIYIATEKEIAGLEKKLKESDRKGNREASKVIVEVLFAAYTRLDSYRDMQKNLPKRSRQVKTFDFGLLKAELG